MVKLGNTKEKVSAICLGTMHFGCRDNREKAYRLLDAYIDAGGSFIDTANIYSYWLPKCMGGESEALLGDWIRTRRSRNDLFLATKVGFSYPGSPGGLNVNQIEKECEKSLRRLGIETIDLYYAHVDDRDVPMEETLHAFDRLIQSGKVRYIGASNFLTWRLEEAYWLSKLHNWSAYNCIQQRHTYVRPNPGGRFTPQVVANDELLEYCRNRGLTILAYSVLLKGAYTRQDREFPDQYLGPDTDNRLKILTSIAKEVDASVNQVILAWMAQSDPPIIPIIAVSDMEQMRENLGALEVVLSTEQMLQLTNANTYGKAW